MLVVSNAFRNWVHGNAINMGLAQLSTTTSMLKSEVLGLWTLQKDF